MSDNKIRKDVQARVESVLDEDIARYLEVANEAKAELMLVFAQQRPPRKEVGHGESDLVTIVAAIRRGRRQRPEEIDLVAQCGKLLVSLGKLIE